MHMMCEQRLQFACNDCNNPAEILPAKAIEETLAEIYLPDQ